MKHLSQRRGRQPAAISIDAAVQLHQRGKLDEAALRYAAILQAEPNHFDARHLLGVLRFQQGRHTEGLGLIQAALKLNAGSAEAWLNSGHVLRKLGGFDEALASYDKAASIRPDYAEAHFGRGLTLRSLKRSAEALTCFDQAVAIRPDFAEAFNSRGNTLHDLRRFEEALASYDKALAIQPANAEALNNRGNLLRDIKRPQEALASFDRALAIRPDFAEALYNRGLARCIEGVPGALGDFARAVEIRPGMAAARIALCVAQLPVLYRDEEEIADCRAAYEGALAELCARVDDGTVPIADVAAGIGLNQPFLLPYQGHNDRDLQSRYGALACRAMAARYGTAPPPPPPEPSEKVRVGIVSGFFCHHTVCKLMISGWLSQLDRAGFAVFGYHTGIRRDRLTETLAAKCERFVSAPLTLDGWREEILADAPHVLIYPEIGMDGISAQLAAQRLAPVQCASWGHPNTTGYPTIDYFLSSVLMEPPDGHEHYSERLIRLPNLSIYYEPQEVDPVTLDRAELGLRPEAIVFWCAQFPSKYLPQFDHVFAKIAARLDDCQFVFIESAQNREVTALLDRRLHRAFADCGLRAAKHCVILPRLDGDRFVAAIGLCDIVLDSIGWSGCNSILEGLTHNLPVVTIPGRLMRGRHATAILQMMGVTETIAASVDEYISIAVRLASDPAWRGKLRARIAENKHRLFRDRRCISALEHFLSQTARGKPVSTSPPTGDTRLPVSPRSRVMGSTSGSAAKLLALGIAAHREGKLEEAASRYAAILAAQPRHFDAGHLLGVLRSQQGRHAEALERIRSALRRQPGNPEALANLGLVLARLGRLDEALAKYDRAVALRPNYAEALHGRGTVLKGLSRLAEALASYDKALAIRPNYAEALNDRGVVLRMLGKLPEALASCERAAALKPDYAEACNNSGTVLRDLGRTEEALQRYDRALALRPDYAEALNNRGTSLRALGRPAEALASYDKALAIQPDYVEALNNRGNALQAVGRPEDALTSFDRALALRPDSADVLRNRGITLLSLGDFRAGWAGYEHRWDCVGAARRVLAAPYPAWRGEELNGRSIIVYEEQGLGDTIHFCRYLTLLEQLGATVSFLARPSMHRLLRSAAGGTRLTGVPPQAETFDFQSALLSLPATFGTTLETVPADVPYLHPEAALVEKWRQRIGDDGCKIGICWQGNPAAPIDVGRSIPLHCFDAVAAVPGVRLVSLQKTHGLDQLTSLPSGLRVEVLADLDAGPDAFVDTAAVIARLDLVITSDTAVAHLAGALGRPVWIVLKDAPDWRWMFGREDSPWYPTARLFRQRQRGDWKEVFARMATALAQMVSGEHERLLSRHRSASDSTQVASIDVALRLHQHGKLEEAAQRCAAILEAQPRHFDALHLLGVIRFRQGRLQDSLDCIRGALKAQPANANALATVGLVLQVSGDAEAALAAYDAALAVRPDDPQSLCNRGVVLNRLGRPEEAIASYQRALAIRPDYREALTNRGNALRDLDRLEEALQSYEQLLALEPGNVEALCNRGAVLKRLNRLEEALANYDEALAIRAGFQRALLGRAGALQDLGRLPEALTCLDQAVEMRPDDPAALYNRGVALASAGRLEDALASYEAALAVSPEHASAHNNRGSVLHELKRYEEALEAYDKALAIRRGEPEALYNRGTVLMKLGRLDAALASLDAALAVQPDNAVALNNRGNVLQGLGRPEEALASYDRALAIQPADGDVLKNRGLTALSIGEFAAGWAGYEHRWDCKDAAPRKLIATYPCWQGQDLNGRTLIIYEEQGLGDTIHFARYLPLFVRLGAEVSFLVRPSMHRLLRTCHPSIRLIDRPPREQVFDFQSALLSLPWAFGTTLETVPADVPYLHPEAALVEKWRQRVGTEELRIGICWQGNPEGSVDVGRSIPLRCFGALAAVPGIRLISLQKTHGLDQLAALPHGMTVEVPDALDSGPDAFVDTASVIANLDLVITSDTAVAHLAGALGRPVWVVLKHSPDWRWMFKRDDSPWYPTARLFRQRQPGDWDEVFARVAAALAERAARPG